MISLGPVRRSARRCAGMAWSAESLIVFRVLQGLGGGMIMPVGMTILAQAAGPAADRPRDERRRRADAARPDPRPGARRLARRRRLLALDLLRQRADRGDRARARLAHPPARRAAATTSASTRSGSRCSRPVWRCSFTACPRPRRAGGLRGSAGVRADRRRRWSLIAAFARHALRIGDPLIDLRLFRRRERRRRGDHDDAVRDGLLRRDVPAAALLPDGARRSRRSTPACCWPRRGSARR